MKFGFEKEFFVMKGREVVLCPNGVPADECGWLAEARGEPRDDIAEAYFSLEADIYRLEQRAEKASVDLKEVPLMKVSRKTRLAAARQHHKGRITYQNIYGHERHKFNMSEAAAGLHISFTDAMHVRTEHDGTQVVNQLFDFVQIFRALDKAFATEILLAKRKPGFYEIKNDLRIEYRSLPNNVDLDKVIKVLGKARYAGQE